jgi:hypothetical protein
MLHVLSLLVKLFDEAQCRDMQQIKKAKIIEELLRKTEDNDENAGINFRHLYYFWVVAKEGGITRAAERLNLAVQTISSQLTLLEQSVGKTLFSQQGRRLVLTEAGRLALGYADQIFLLGEQMQEALNEADSGASA